MLLGGALAFCVLFSLRAATPAESPQFEYLVTTSDSFDVPGIDVIPAENNQFVYHPDRAQEALNRRGQQGWELVTISQPSTFALPKQTIAVFKRRIDHPK